MRVILTQQLDLKGIVFLVFSRREDDMLESLIVALQIDEVLGKGLARLKVDNLRGVEVRVDAYDVDMDLFIVIV